jgi:hypothetical protein
MNELQWLAFLQMVQILGAATLLVVGITALLEHTALGERFDRLGEWIFPPRDVR